MGGGECRPSILINANVICRYFLDLPVNSKIEQCRPPILNMAPVVIFQIFLSILKYCLSNLRKCLVVRLDLRVKSPRGGSG